VIPTAEIAWIAGLLEGEGSFSLNGRACSSPRISIGMTDEDVIRKAHALFRTPNKVYGPYTYGRPARLKPIWHIHVTGRLAAAWMMTLYSLMGQRRRAKIRECLGMWRRGETHKQRAIKSRQVAANCLRWRQLLAARNYPIPIVAEGATAKDWGSLK
jgi:hypothetical protein